MSKPRDNRQQNLLQPALKEIIDLGHPPVRLAREIDWEFFDGRFSSVCRSGPGQPPLPSRLVAGLLILKHMHDLNRPGFTGGSKDRMIWSYGKEQEIKQVFT